MSLKSIEPLSALSTYQHFKIQLVIDNLMGDLNSSYLSVLMIIHVK